MVVMATVAAAAVPTPLVAIHMDAAYLIIAGHYFSHAAYPEQGRSPQTQYRYVFTGETVQLNCNIQPGRARILYSAQWNRNNMQIADTTFSLSIPVQDVSQNSTVYQCTVAVQSCSPISSDRCAAASRTAVGDPITLVVGGECT